MASYPNDQGNPAGAIPVYVVDAPTPGRSGNNAAHINSLTTTTVKSGAGTLASVIINNPGTGLTVKIYDSLTGSGTLLGAISLPYVDSESIAPVYFFNVNFATGLTVVTSGAGVPDITVTYL